MFSPKDTKHIKDYVTSLEPTMPGLFFYYLLPVRKKVVLNNLKHVFDSVLSQADIQKVAKCFYGHMAKSLYENIQLKFMSNQQIKDRVEIIGEDHVKDSAERIRKGAAILAGHFGNWEFAPIGGILNFTRYQNRFYVIRKTLKNKFIENILFGRYKRAGLNVIPKKNALSTACDVLEDEDLVIFIMDQHAKISVKDGIMVDFFGKKAGTYRSLAMIVRATGVKVVPMTSYRRRDGKHVVEFMPALSWIEHENSKEELLINTRAYNEVLERMVIAHPEQWLWMHKRWKAG